MAEDRAPAHIKALDGVRGIAVLLVMQFHFSQPKEVSTLQLDRLVYQVLATGWIGVDLFFALSGFLITGILLRSRDRAHYFSSFYGRRTLRIFPLYYLYLALIFFLVFPLAAGRLAPAEQQKMLGAISSWPWFFTYLSNLRQAFTGEFFGAGLGHLWSLAIEEQFYLVWPVVVLAAAGKRLVAVCIALLGVALALRVFMSTTGVDPTIIYVFTPTRIDGLVGGALVAVLLQRWPEFRVPAKPFPLAVALAFLLLVVVGPWPISHPVIYTLGFTLIAVFSSWLICLGCTAAAGSTTARILESPALTFFGKYSYALYLFHPLVRIVMDKLVGDPRLLLGSQLPWQLAFTCVSVLLSSVVAVASWALFEKHFLKFKDVWFSRPAAG